MDESDRKRSNLSASAEPDIVWGFRYGPQTSEIEAGAKRRLADEYDAAQERGEVAKLGTNQSGVTEQNTRPATAEELGIDRKDIHEARIIRDAEVADPGVVRRTLGGTNPSARRSPGANRFTSSLDRGVVLDTTPLCSSR
jgi:hypothetical protein